MRRAQNLGAGLVDRIGWMTAPGAKFKRPGRGQKGLDDAPGGKFKLASGLRICAR